MSAKPARERPESRPPKRFSIDGDYSGHHTGVDPTLSEPMPLPQDEAEMLNILAKKFINELYIESSYKEEQSKDFVEKSILQIKLEPIFSGIASRESMSEALKRIRKAEGLSQRAAAERAGVTYTEIGRIEQGSASVEKSAEVLGALGFQVEMRVSPTPKS